MKRLILNLLVLLGISSNAYGEGIDGLFASFGVGVASTKTDFASAKSGWSTGESGNEMGLAGSFKVGYGVDKDLAVYLFRESSFVFGYDNDPDESSYGNCITGLGFLYYLDSSNIFNTIFGIGEGQFTKVSEADSKGEKGGGYVVGLGVNLFPNIHLELSKLETDIDDNIDLKSESTRLTLNYYWY